MRIRPQWVQQACWLAASCSCCYLTDKTTAIALHSELTTFVIRLFRWPPGSPSQWMTSCFGIRTSPPTSLGSAPPLLLLSRLSHSNALTKPSFGSPTFAVLSLRFLSSNAVFHILLPVFVLPLDVTTRACHDRVPGATDVVELFLRTAGLPILVDQPICVLPNVCGA